ncbi:MAG: O-antigen ligase family protein [Dehalococcoidia bacterium]
MIIILALFAAVTPLVIVTEMQDEWVLPKLAATVVFTGVALAWGAVQLARDRWPSLRVPTTLWLALGAFVVINLLAFVFAIDWRSALFGQYLRYQGLATVLLYVLLFGVAVVAVRSPRDLRWLLIGLFAGAVGTSIYALMQKAGVAWWPDPLPDRPGSTVGQSNELGAFLVVAGSAAMFLVFTSNAIWQRALFAAGVVVMIAALAVTTSQSAYLAAGVVIILWGAAAVYWAVPALVLRPSAPAAPKGRTRGERRRRSRGERDAAQEAVAPARDMPSLAALRVALVAFAAAPLLLGAIIILFVGLPGREAVVDAYDTESVQGRLNLWQLGIEMAADRPIVGHGQDAYSLLFASYRDSPDLGGIGTRNLGPESAHNFYVDLVANTGVLGLLSFLALIGSIFWYAGRRLLTTVDVTQRYALLALGTALTGYLAAIFFGFSEAMTTWVFWLLLGALVGLIVRAEAPGEEQAPARPPNAIVSAGAAVALMLVAMAAVGWATTLVAADLAAAQATEATLTLEHKRAADLADRAVTLNPLQRSYLLQEAQIYDRAFIQGQTRADSFRKEVDLYETALARFRPQAFDMYGLAQAKRKLAEEEGHPFKDLIPDYERALELDPFNRDLRRLVITAYRANGEEDLARFHEAIIYCWTGACP